MKDLSLEDLISMDDIQAVHDAARYRGLHRSCIEMVLSS